MLLNRNRATFSSVPNADTNGQNRFCDREGRYVTALLYRTPRSQHGDVSEDDIEVLVREFFDEFGGDIRGVRPGPARAGGDVFQLDVPDVLSGDQVAGRYEQATFTRQVAMEEDDVDFIALDHPLVQSLIEFCLDSNRIDGQVAVKVASDGESGPGSTGGNSTREPGLRSSRSPGEERDVEITKTVPGYRRRIPATRRLRLPEDGVRSQWYESAPVPGRGSGTQMTRPRLFVRYCSMSSSQRAMPSWTNGSLEYVSRVSPRPSPRRFR